MTRERRVISTAAGAAVRVCMLMMIVPSAGYSQDQDHHDIVMIMERRDNRWLALAVVCMGQLMMILDATIVAVWLPPVKRDLDFSPFFPRPGVDAYFVRVGRLLPLAGRPGGPLPRPRLLLARVPR